MELPYILYYMQYVLQKYKHLHSTNIKSINYYKPKYSDRQNGSFYNLIQVNLVYSNWLKSVWLDEFLTWSKCQDKNSQT